jgi:transposase-like protein
MPKAYPKEFRQDVIAVARRGDQSMSQVARSFGVSESCLNRWLAIDARASGTSGSAPTVDQFDPSRVRELLKRNKQLEQENEILRRATAYFARDTLPK